MTKKNEVAAKQETGVAVSAPPPVSQSVAGDILIPRLLLMQATSDFVGERKAVSGDIVRSTNAEKLGDPDKMIDFIPLNEPVPTWITECRALGAQRWSFKGISPRNASNDHLPWKFNADQDGKPLAEGVKSPVEWRRVKCLSLFAILPQDIDAFEVEMAKVQKGETPDLSKALTPVQISFRSTSFNAGKEISTYFRQAQSFRMQPHNFMLMLGCQGEKNDQGSFYVFKVDRNKPTPVKSEYLPRVQEWAHLVTNTVFRIDETGEGDDSPAPVAQGNF